MTRPIVRREIRDAVRRWWFLVNTGAFVVAGIALVAFGRTGALVAAGGTERALAGLMQLALVLVPLVALVPSAAAIAGAREDGTLEYLLAQPVTRSRVWRDTWLGVAIAVVASVAVGLAFTGAAAALAGVTAGPIAALIGMTVLLALAFVSVGFWISAEAGSRTRAMSLALTAWIVLLGLGSLGVLTAFVRWGLPAEGLMAWALVDPVEAYRVSLVVALDPDSGVLGPVGEVLLDRLGAGGVVAAGSVSLAAWSAVGYAFGRRAFRRPEDRAGGGRLPWRG